MGSDCGDGICAVASGAVVALGTRGVNGVMVSDESPPPPPPPRLVLLAILHKGWYCYN
ncbi:hypothetical protein HanIR_Chr05g0228541 [Helianthus annuus]|nr:hypothetical protein HanIR_Chr05g0228541 [Helianthus annuus]